MKRNDFQQFTEVLISLNEENPFSLWIKDFPGIHTEEGVNLENSFLEGYIDMNHLIDNANKKDKIHYENFMKEVNESSVSVMNDSVYEKFIEDFSKNHKLLKYKNVLLMKTSIYTYIEPLFSQIVNKVNNRWVWRNNPSLLYRERVLEAIHYYSNK